MDRPDKKQIFSWVIAGLIIILVFFLGKSKELYEQFFVSWLETCRIVIDVGFDDSHVGKPIQSIPVDIYGYGDIPKELHIHFASTKMNLVKVRYERSFSDENLLEHSWSEKSCPPQKENSFCRASGKESEPSKDINIVLLEYSRNYKPRLMVSVDTKIGIATERNLGVFVQQPLGEKLQVCHVEPARLTNFWVWTSQSTTIIGFMLIFILLSILIGLFRYYSSKKE